MLVDITLPPLPDDKINAQGGALIWDVNRQILVVQFKGSPLFCAPMLPCRSTITLRQTAMTAALKYTTAVAEYISGRRSTMTVIGLDKNDPLGRRIVVYWTECVFRRCAINALPGKVTAVRWFNPIHDNPSQLQPWFRPVASRKPPW